MSEVINQAAAEQKAKQLIENMGGIIRTSEALRDGIHPRVFYNLRDNGILEQISRGVFRLAERKPLTNVDLVTVASRIPRAIICLVSALAFHKITTQIPHSVSIALELGAQTPQIGYPPLTVHRFSDKSLEAGVEDHIIDGISVHIYNREKTIADCFKFRNKLGMDITLEALKLYMQQRAFDADKLLCYARICRVEKIMKPYLEAML